MLLKLFSIENSESNQVETIAQKQSLDVLVQGTRTAQTGTHVNFQKPRFHVGVDDDVKAINLEARTLMLGASHRSHDWIFHGKHCLDQHVFNSLKGLVKIDALLFKFLRKLGQAEL